MQKTKRQLLWLALALVVCLFIYAALSLLSSPQQQEGSAALNTFDANTINGISYLSSGETVVLEKNEEGEWFAPAQPQRTLRQGPVAAMATQSGRLRAVDTVADSAAGLAAYGLDAPANVITLRQGVRQVTYLIGIKNSVTGDYYLQIQGEPQIYTVHENFVQVFYGDIAYLTEPPAEETE